MPIIWTSDLKDCIICAKKCHDYHGKPEEIAHGINALWHLTKLSLSLSLHVHTYVSLARRIPWLREGEKEKEGTFLSPPPTTPNLTAYVYSFSNRKPLTTKSHGILSPQFNSPHL